MTASRTPSSPPPSPKAPPPTAAPDGTGAPVEKRSYKDTLNLPKSAFPMKANLVQNEPATLKRWAAMNLYQRVRQTSKGRSPFVFHDGPPYANGSIHLGHLLNKSLKDFVVRCRTMAGLDCPYVPGWDCHGLPIEHKVMLELQEAGKLDKLNSLSEGDRKMAIRRECRRYAEKYHKLHTQQMTRLLTLADYEHPYLTMSAEYEGATLEVLAGLVEQGLVYRAIKPVHWSIANETALAEAELEYKDREDISVYVDFEARDSKSVYDAFGLPPASVDDVQDDAGAPAGRPTQTPSFMIWTTTPWTLPANVAVAIHPDYEYALVRVDGNVAVLAAALVEKVTAGAKAEEVQVLATVKGQRLLGLRYRHPFMDTVPACGLGHACDAMKVWSLVAADYVTLEDGTGLVHTAPGHGVEDYQTGLREGLPVYCPVRADGTYDNTVPEWLQGMNVFKANDEVARRLRESGHLFYEHTFSHSYPHDWRSKTPVIFRCTEQWFVSVDGRHGRAAGTAHDVDREHPGSGRNLRSMAIEAVAEGGPVKFVPEWGRNRMRGMLESRPDWCISRQRAWGLPIPAFFGPDGTVLMTSASVRAVARVVREKGSDAWFQLAPADLLKHYDPKSDPDAPHSALDTRNADLAKGGDILDVWFESGSSWNAVLRERSLGYPADLYLEGSDQHRGWFQLSLLPALGVTGQAPFKAILTHGFMVNKEGRKLSKSKGDTVEDLFQEYGVDVLRWWVSSLAYENDMKVDEEFFKVAGESYRKVRNTLRFMLSNLDDFASHQNTAAQLPPTSLDAWVLAEYDRMSGAAARAYQEYDFRTVHNLCYDFCNHTLSAVYLAAVKDRLYCDRPDSPRRRRTQATLWKLTDGLCRLLAPVLCHTADEAYRSLLKADDKNAGDLDTCVHLQAFITGFGVKADPRWDAIMAAREKAQLKLEEAKAALGVENPLDAGVVYPDPDGKLKGFDPADLADLLGVSRASLDPAATEPRVLDLRNEPRCERSWKRDGTVKQRRDGGMLSDRDAEALKLA